MKKAKTPPTDEQIQDSVRLRKLFDKYAGMSQLEFGQTHGIGNQGMVWQYLNADKPKGSVLNVEAAIKFAKGLHRRVSDFSPSIQQEIDRIAGFATPTEGVSSMREKKDDGPSDAKPEHQSWPAYEHADEAQRALVNAILDVGKTPPWVPLQTVGILVGATKKAANDWQQAERKKAGHRSQHETENRN
jgi:hypothetical protein